jgi:uroporphyrin-III C-methyltransferase/precorrin-2 dehydrogenase/sirohydrochlorin ferrochelatase
VTEPEPNEREPRRADDPLAPSSVGGESSAPEEAPETEEAPEDLAPTGHRGHLGEGRDPYLIGLRLEGRLVLVVGGGSVATRRVPALLAAGADVHLVSPEATATLEDLADAGRIRWSRRGYQPGDCEGAWLAVASASDHAANAAVAQEAETNRIWCTRADDAAGSAAWTPAVGSAGEVRVAVLSGDPRRSARLRDGIVSGLRDGTIHGRHERRRPAGVALVGGGPGDPGLITVRGRQLLAEADVVVTDRLGPRQLLDELPPDVEIVDAAKVPYGRAMAQEAINDVLITRAREGKFVVRLKGGDPFVFGRGGEEVGACLRAGIPVTVVPGVTSAVGVPTSAGIPVTHRGTAQEFHVISAHVPPGDPRSTVDWETLAKSTGTLVLMMALERIGAVAAELVRHGRDTDTPVSVIAEGTMPTQRTIFSTLEKVEKQAADARLRPPAIVVVGGVVAVAEALAELAPDG